MSALNAPLPGTAVQTTGGSTTAAGPTGKMNSLNEKDFLTLLTTQLQHQDPAHPVSQTRLAAELAQFSTASGVNALNQKLQGLQSGAQANRLTRSVALVGRQVATSGDAMVPDSTGQATGAFRLGGDASDVRVAVFDGSGKVVDRLDLGAQGAGLHTFPWHGGQPGSAYRFAVQGRSAGGQPVPTTSYSVFRVAGVHLSGGQAMLDLANEPQPLALSQVQDVL
ncbi:MAG TPA: flagellar hook capping FlgD N-terminal domain-containing protein [Gammaproteobacteria bacterium]|nr:flagellar hook capping FlgD N-terminal domain-containing protein [Gammaproteobacteria bacterium]